MTVRFYDDVPPDVAIEQAVDRAIAEGLRLPRWGWPTPGPYNGATGGERIIGWQKVRIAQCLGLLENSGRCGLCGSCDAAHLHAELYFRALLVKSICRSCHFHIHKRFQRPDLWAEKLVQFPTAQSWVRALPPVELSRAEALVLGRQPDAFAALSRTAQGTINRC